MQERRNKLFLATYTRENFPQNDVEAPTLLRACASLAKSSKLEIGEDPDNLNAMEIIVRKGWC
jgi:hypothetical protein